MRILTDKGPKKFPLRRFFNSPFSVPLLWYLFYGTPFNTPEPLSTPFSVPFWTPEPLSTPFSVPLRSFYKIFRYPFFGTPIIIFSQMRILTRKSPKKFRLRRFFSTHFFRYPFFGTPGSSFTFSEQRISCI